MIYLDSISCKPLDKHELRNVTKQTIGMAREIYHLESLTKGEEAGEDRLRSHHSRKLMLDKTVQYWYAKLYESYALPDNHGRSRVDLDYLYSIDVWILEAFLPLLVKDDERGKRGHDTAIKCGHESITINYCRDGEEELFVADLKDFDVDQVEGLRMAELGRNYLIWYYDKVDGEYTDRIGRPSYEIGEVGVPDLGSYHGSDDIVTHGTLIETIFYDQYLPPE